MSIQPQMIAKGLKHLSKDSSQCELEFIGFHCLHWERDFLMGPKIFRERIKIRFPDFHPCAYLSSWVSPPIFSPDIFSLVMSTFLFRNFEHGMCPDRLMALG